MSGWSRLGSHSGLSLEKLAQNDPLQDDIAKLFRLSKKKSLGPPAKRKIT
jgi:hypothetical protein